MGTSVHCRLPPVYSEETTGLPAKGADDKLLRVLEDACQKILGPTAKASDLVHTVQEFIVERPPKGSANIDVIADQPNLSSKTLERRLAEPGQSFSALLDETRCKAAKHCLEEAGIAHVAYMAGYTEAVALVRVFMRWTGATPMQFRDRSRAAASCSSRLC
jgi:AraC-like DNA-binding protein